MRQITFNADFFGQMIFAFSSECPESGTKVWAVNYGGCGDHTSEHETKILSLPEEVLDHCLSICENRWTGWSFEPLTLQPLLLFVDPADAMLAELLYSTQEA